MKIHIVRIFRCQKLNCPLKSTWCTGVHLSCVAAEPSAVLFWTNSFIRSSTATKVSSLDYYEVLKPCSAIVSDYGLHFLREESLAEHLYVFVLSVVNAKKFNLSIWLIDTNKRIRTVELELHENHISAYAGLSGTSELRPWAHKTYRLITAACAWRSTMVLRNQLSTNFVIGWSLGLTPSDWDNILIICNTIGLP